jgi:hypothetical protein
MAKEKNPARKETMFERLSREAKEFDASHPILDTRYYVKEYDRHDGYYIDDDRTPAPSTLKRTFGPFTRAEFDNFMEKYEPDEGHHFVPTVENLRHYCYDKWGK